MVRRTVQTLALVYMLVVGQDSYADQFEIASHAQNGVTIPFLHPPGTCPDRGLCISSYEQANLNVAKKCGPFKYGGIVLSVEYVCVNRCYYWRTSLEFSSDLLYRTLTYKYPGFVESDWYVDFWNAVKKTECGNVVNVDTAEPHFWELFVDMAPKSYADLLKQEYGLEKLPNGGTSGAAVNILPGMRLRLENALWQDVTKTSSEESAAIHRGYVGTGTSYLMVNRQSPGDKDLNQNEFLSFEPFFGHTKANFQIPSQQNANLGSGVIDLHVQSQRYSHFRLFIPSDFTGSSQVAGTALIDNYPLLIGAAPDKADSLSASNLSQQLNSANWSNPLPDGSLIYTGFRGRSAVIPEVLVNIRGDHEYISVATTIRQILDRYNEGNTLEELRVHSCVQRKWHGKTFPIHFCGKSIREYDLPLSRGDRLPCFP